MKFWEPINDIAHDVTRWVKGWGKKDAQAVDNEGEQWSDNPLFQEKTEADRLRSMDRKVLNRSDIEKSKGYEKISHSPSVKKLLENIDDYYNFMVTKKIPTMSGMLKK